jgi:hypothetical protein
LRAAQEELRQSVVDLGLEPVLFPAGPALVKFRDILQFGRDRCTGASFVWSNSDVILRRNPFETDDSARVHGFHRTEIPSGQICGGVDMYLIPCGAWDGWLGSAAPDLWCGATHVDWWLTNAAALKGLYRAHRGFIDHVSHETTGPSKARRDPHYRHNVRTYNAWARRVGAAEHRERLCLPLVGESQTPLSDLLHGRRGA